MSQTEKAEFYNELKAAGVKFDRHYREYSTEELQAAVAQLRANPDYQPPAQQQPAQEASRPAQPITEGLTNTFITTSEEPVRVDENGLTWYVEEIRKPAIPKPRARRVLKYIETGVQTKTISNGQYLETFEVAGEEQRQAEVKITLPSYQVGIYKDPRYPFKVHVYNDARGFDLFEVQKFYGGADLVPAEVRRIYVGTDLCYDMTSVVRAIQTEYRQTQLNRS